MKSLIEINMYVNSTNCNINSDNATATANDCNKPADKKSNIFDSLLKIAVIVAKLIKE
jgi:hypothetical protein